MPDPHQVRAAQHLLGRLVGGLALDPGLGKTACTLAAFTTLHSAGKVRTMLVIAPLRVCRHVWRQEGAKWSQFRHLRFAFLHGSKKEHNLRAGLAGGTEIFLINPEGVRWLANMFFGRQLPFDVVTIDELTRFKNARSDRHKALLPRIVGVPRKWGLTGSLAPNGYMDLFGQMLLLDNGAALGRYITHYRDRYFQVGWDGFSYDLIPGADEKIVERIGPYWLQMSAEDYIALPPLVERPHLLELEPAERKLYTRMKNDMLAELPGGVIEAGNAAACYAKLAQLANGAVYHMDGRVEHVHDAKIDALDSIAEELAGQPMLVGFEFRHDLMRLQVWHKARFGRDLPYLGGGQTEKQEEETLRRWNLGELPVLAAHPASAGHGLNMQEGAAAHLVWFGITWDFELFDQFVRRIRRRGNEAQRIFMHLLIVTGTIDELKLSALRGKDMTQQALFVALNRAARDELSPTQERDMVQKLSSRAAVTGPAAQQNPGGAATGWGGQSQGGGQALGQQQPQGGQQSGWGPQGQQAAAGWGGQTQGQREAVQEAVMPRESVRGAFSGSVQEQADAVANGDYGEAAPQGSWGQQTGQQQAPAEAADSKPKRTRAKPKDDAPFEGGTAREPDFAAMRLTIMIEVMRSDSEASVEDIIDVTDDLARYVLTGEKPAG